MTRVSRRKTKLEFTTGAEIRYRGKMRNEPRHALPAIVSTMANATLKTCPKHDPFSRSHALWAGDAPAPDQRPDKPSPPAVPKKKPEPEKVPEEEPLRRAA